MSFLRDYLIYASGNEAPDMFHVWSGYAALSAAVSRRVWLPFEDSAIFPNLYVMLVGDAGNGKSWALKKSKRLLAELDGVSISGSIETPEGLLRFMAGQPDKDPPLPSPVSKIVKWPDGQRREVFPMTIIANEFVNFISQNQTGWVAMLNDIYDEDHYHYRTKGKGEDVLPGPYIVLLGALTTDVSADLQKARIISTGLARRTLFQYGQRKWNAPVARPMLTAEQKACRVKALESLKRIQKLSGPFLWSDEIEEWYRPWYEEQLIKVPLKAPTVQSWYASKSTQVIKLAMLTCISETGGLKLEIPHFELSLRYLDELEKDLPKIFGSVGRNELAPVTQRIYEYVCNQSDPVSERKLKTNFFMDCKPPDEFETCLQHLLNAKQLFKNWINVDGEGDYLVYDDPTKLERFLATLKAGGVQIELRQGTSDEANPTPWHSPKSQ